MFSVVIWGLCFVYSLINLSSVLCQPLYKLCIYATPNKPVGSYYYASGKAYIQSFTEFRMDSKYMCNEKCRINDHCFATSFDRRSMCLFYNTSDFEVIIDNTGLQFSLWKVCNMSDGYQPNDGRCLGLWVTYLNEYMSIDSYGTLGNNSLGMLKCRYACLEHPLCGFVNHQENMCTLVPKWPYVNLHKTPNIIYDTHKWTCVDNFVNILQIPKKVFKPTESKCMGYWEIVSRNTSSGNPNITGIFFQTQIYNECLAECSQYSKCHRVWYNVTYSICILVDISTANNILPVKNATFIIFEWKCIRNDSYQPVMNKDEERYSEFGMKCYQITNNLNLFIGKDNCGRHPKESMFYPCFEDSRSSKNWRITDSCLVNQSYWAFPMTSEKMNIFNHSFMNLTMIYSGIQVYWLAYVDDNNLKEVDYLECRSFNASRSTDKLETTEIILREQWNSLPPNGSRKRYSERPIYIVVTASQQPVHSCKTLAACIDILRRLQVLYFHGAGTTKKYSDNPYNFMINENGHIFECRGWKHECAVVAGNNWKSFCIAYIGWFKDDLPGERFLNSLKKLIEYSVDHGYVQKPYKLYIQQDLTRSSVHRNLEIVIKNWYRYRGFLPEDCVNYSILIIILNFFSVLILSVVLIIFYGKSEFRTCCPRCKFLDCSRCTFRLLFPPEREFQTADEMQTYRNNYKLDYFIYERPTILSTSRMTEVIKLIKIWFFNQFLETYSSRFLENDLSNFLNSFRQRKWNPLIFEVSVFRNGEIASHKDAILCVSDTSMLNQFKRLVKMKLCICYYFHLDRVEQIHLNNGIQVI